MNSSSTSLVRRSFDFVGHYGHNASKVAATILDGLPHSSGFGSSGRMRRDGKGVTLQAGKTDYSDCRRVRLAGWATPSFWQRRIPLVMSSNERAFFIPLARYVQASGKKGGKRQKRWEKGKRKNKKRKWWKKDETIGGSKNSARIMEYASRAYTWEAGVRKRCQGCAWLKSMAAPHQPGPTNSFPGPNYAPLTSPARTGTRA